MFYRQAKSPYQKIEDLKGKNLGLVDPNSTSGNNVPRFVLDQPGHQPDTFFGKVVYAGSHENAVLALAQGQVDVAANQWTSDTDSTLQQMLTKGMLKNADGSPMKKEDFRIIGKSDEIAERPLHLSRRHACGSEGRDRQGVPGRAEEGQDRIRQAFGRQAAWLSRR